MHDGFLQIHELSIRRELERITSSWEFYNSRRLQDVLRFMVEETLAGRGQEIKAYTIAIEVLQRPASFDPQTDAVVRVVVGKLRKRLARFYELRGISGPVRISIPVGRYMPQFSLCENLPDSGQDFLQGGQMPEQVPAPLAGSPGDGAAGRGLVSSNPAPYFPSASGPAMPAAGAVLSAPAVLVYPFFNYSPGAEADHIVSGFVEEIVIGLTKFSDFTVISANYCRPQPFQLPDGEFAATHKPWPPHPAEAPWELARQVGARFVLQGNIQIFGGSMRVRVILTDAVSRSSIWAEHYDADFDTNTIFHVLDEITNKVLAGIAGSFGFINKVLLSEVERGSAGSRPDVQFSVYEAVLYYHHWVGTLNAENEGKALASLEASVAAAPHYGMVKAMLADIYATRSQWRPDAEAADLEKRSFALALDAEAINPACQYAQWAKCLNFFLHKQEEDFIKSSRLVVAINPANTNLVSAVGVRLVSFGMLEEGFAIIESARKYNPFLPEWYRLATFLASYLAGDWESALSEASQIRWPGYVVGPILRAAVLGQLGQAEAARTEFEDITRLAPHFKQVGRRALGKLYYHDRNADAVLEGLRKAGLDISG